MSAVFVRREVIERCRAWLRTNDCPLPVDLHLEAEAIGIDTRALEQSELHESTREEEINGT